MKKRILVAAALTGATAAGLAYWKTHKPDAAAEAVPSPAEAASLIAPETRLALADRLRAALPTGGFKLVLSDDNGLLARTLAGSSRMLFSADGAGCAAKAQPYEPETLISAACDLSRLWLAENSLDAAVAVNAIQRCASAETALAELHRVLKPGALLALPTTVRPENLSESAWLSTLSLLGVQAHSALTADTLRTLVCGAGFDLVEEELLPSGFPLDYLLCRVVK